MRAFAVATLLSFSLPCFVFADSKPTCEGTYLYGESIFFTLPTKPAVGEQIRMHYEDHRFNPWNSAGFNFQYRIESLEQSTSQTKYTLTMLYPDGSARPDEKGDRMLVVNGDKSASFYNIDPESSSSILVTKNLTCK